MLVLRFWFVRLAAALVQTRDALELHVYTGMSCNRPLMLRLWSTSTPRPVPSYTGAGRWSW